MLKTIELKKKIIVLLLLFVSSLFAGPAEDKGLEIAKMIDASTNGYIGEKGEMSMILINAYGDKTIRKMIYKMKETINDGDKSITEFLWPADVKGTKLLTWVHKKKNDSQWLYLPSLKRIKRISAQNRSGSFMGSEFAFEDITSQEVEKYKYKYLREEKLNGRNCWIIERYPVDKDSGYSKQVAWVDKEYITYIKVDYYDKKGKLLKTSIFEGFKKISGFWRFSSIKMTNHQTSKESILTWNKQILKIKFRDNEFNSDVLEE